MLQLVRGCAGSVRATRVVIRQPRFCGAGALILTSPTGKRTLTEWPQCVSEGWSDKIKQQAEEGCNIAGKVRVNKVIGNFHISPGRSFQANAMHVHDLVPYLQDGNKHDFGHVIHGLWFGSEAEEEFVGAGGVGLEETKKALGIVNPLDGVKAHTEESN